MEDYRVTQTGDEIQEILNQSPVDTADIVELKEAATSLDGRLESVEGKIPAGASEENPLADKQYVDDSIASASATFRGTYNEVTDLELTTDATHADIGSALDEVIEFADSNDYCFVQIPTDEETPTEIESIERYKFVTGGWEYEYTLNNSGFTAEQWAAINSGITSGLVTKLTDLPTNAELNTLLNGKANAADVYTKSETYNKDELDSMITTPDVKYVSVTATAQTTSVTDVLPATGAADTIYRVGSWDGTQYDANSYSEYAWNGTAYVPLSVKDAGIATGSDFDNPTAAQRALLTPVGAVLDGCDAVPTAGSVKPVQSGGVYGVVEELHTKVGGKNQYTKEVSQSGRSQRYNIAIDSGYTVKVTLLACSATLSSGIRIRGIIDTDPATYMQFGNLTSVGQTLTKVLTDDIIAIDTYNNDSPSGSSYKIEWEKAITGSINEEISEIEGNVSSLTGRVGTLETSSAALEALAAESGEKVTITTSSSGIGKQIIYSDFHIPTSPSDNENYSISNPISVPAHGVIATFATGVLSRISKVAPDDKYIPLVQGINNRNTCVSWINNSDETVNVVICYMSTNPVAFIHKNVFSSILATIPNIEQYGKLQDTTPVLTMVAGSVSNGTINTSSQTYVHSEPFFANKNDLIILINSRSGNNVALLYKTDANASYAEHIVHGVQGNTVQYRYYVCKESGYYGISGPGGYLSMKKYTPSAGYVQSVGEDGKKKVGITYSKTAGDNDITISDAPYCQITKGAAVKISGSGDCTITGTLAESVIGRCFSIGLKLPYATQNVAGVTVNNATFNKAVDDNRTLSGKSYEVEGDHYHRVNYNIKYALLSSFTIVIESETEWVIEVSTEGVVNDDLPLTPILVGYDRARDFPATFPYEGENISIYELHKRLQIPYYVSLTVESTVVADNAEIREAIEAGLCEPVFYSGGSGLVPYWNATDGSLAQQTFIRKAAVGTCGGMLVVSQHVMDRNMYSNFLNSGVKILRHHAMFAERSSGFSEKYGDNEVLYAHSSGLGATTFSNFLRFPQVFYGHGIGTPTDPDDPYADTHYVDRDGTNTIALFTMWKEMQSQGRVMVMKPSDWLDYCKKH